MLLEFRGASGATSFVEASIHVVVLVFTLFYVIWGGYRAVILTERYQVPAAYVSFVLFGVGVLVVLSQLPPFRTFGLALLGMLAMLLCFILFIRLRLFGLNSEAPPNERPADIQSARTAAWLTFLPLIAITLFALLGCALATGVIISPAMLEKMPKDVPSILWPAASSWLGFGLAGAVSLFLANSVWQIIDISSLQRLQSVSGKFSDSRTRESVAKALEVTGIEAGIGWSLIVVVGLALRALGVDKPEIIGAVLLEYAAAGFTIAGLVIPVFLFAVSVFMLSTISGFMSALSYVSFYDLVGASDTASSEEASTLHGANALSTARQVTFLVVVFIYIAYSLLKASMPDDKISAALYAIYAFQLTILPIVFWVFLIGGTRYVCGRDGVSHWAVLFSVLAGFVVAWITATQPELLGPYIEEDLNYVIPPLAVILTCSLIFFPLNVMLANRAEKNA